MPKAFQIAKWPNIALLITFMISPYNKIPWFGPFYLSCICNAGFPEISEYFAITKLSNAFNQFTNIQRNKPLIAFYATALAYIGKHPYLLEKSIISVREFHYIITRINLIVDII